MHRRILYFTAPRQIEIREESLPSLKDDEVLVKTACSAISAGTEMLVYHNRFPRDLDTDSVISSLRGGFEYPLAYGYACVGNVVDVGKEVNRKWLNRLVFAFQPHTSHFIAATDSLLAIPDLLATESACFLPNMETAVNLVQDAAPIFGERVLVLGQGVVGLLVAALLKEFPLEALVTADRHELRRRASLALGVTDSVDPDALHTNRDSQPRSAYPQKYDLVFELSGSPFVLNDAISQTVFSGRVIIGSWYGEKRADIDLGGAFHRSRIRLISSQVSTIAPELGGRWDKARRFRVAWEALKRIQPQNWITHRFPIESADQAYRLLDESPQETIQVIFEYGHGI